MTFLLYICIFAIGWFSHTLFIYIFNLGSSVILLKRVLAETLLFIANLVQDIYELQELKRYELEKTGKSEKQIELQKVLDKIPNKENGDPQVKLDSETEISLVKPSQSLFTESTDKEN